MKGEWKKGDRVLIGTGKVVTVGNDGIYGPVFGDGYEGWVWHYQVMHEDGSTEVRIPESGDRILQGAS